MGIKRLYNYLSFAFQKQNISEIKNVKVGIDAMGWLYQAYFGYCEDSKDIKLAIIRNIEMKVKLLEKSNIDFYFVIDGRSLNCKSNTRAFRDMKRDKHLKKSKEMERDNYDIGESSIYKKYSEKVSIETIYFFIDFLKVKKYKFIVSPYESDSQLYYLYKRGCIDYIISEDSDIVAFGCLNVIKGFKKNGECQILNEDTIKQLKKMVKNKDQQNLTKIKKCMKFFNFSQEQRIQICIACGCDYLENIKGIGFGTILDKIDIDYTVRQFLKDYCKEIDNQKLKLYPEGICNKKEYLRYFDFVQIAFQHQLVFDNEKYKIKSLSKLNKDKLNQFSEKDQKEIYSYIGDKNLFDNPKAFLEGRIDFKTMKKRNKTTFEFDRAIKFINSAPIKKTFTLSNLCSKSYGYHNFEDFINDGDKLDSEKSSQTEEIGSKKHKVNQLSLVILNDESFYQALNSFQG